jgi:hypothetical protein
MKTHCCCGAPLTDPVACGCCEGVEIVTPQSTVNRPGLPALSYRIGTHATFLETMKARLSSSDFPALAKLTSREADDPAIALLDAWATVGDVLTFYQERIANEGYLRTATERRSVLELARLVGYQPRPGVAASVYLAYILENTFKEETTIAKGARSQSIPGPGELPQSFETSEDLKARAAWNNIKPRMIQPQTAASICKGDGRNARIYLKGIATNLKPNDPLLVDLDCSGEPKFHRVKEVKPDAKADRTLVTLQATVTKNSRESGHQDANLIGALTLPASVQVANSLKLDRNVEAVFRGSGIEMDKSNGFPLRKTLAGGEASHAALKAFAPVLRETLATATENAQVTKENPIKVYALRNKASAFGHNMPLPEPPIVINVTDGTPAAADSGLPLRTLALDAEYKEIKMQDWVAVEWKDTEAKLVVSQVENVSIQTLGGAQTNELAFFTTRPPETKTTVGSTTHTSTGEPILTKSTILTLERSWRTTNDMPQDVLRGTNVFFQSEELELSEEPIDEIVCGGTDELLELDGLYEGLESGRWVIVSGERDIPGTSGVRFSELAMLASVTQRVGVQVKVPKDGNNSAETKTTVFQVVPGDKTRTFIQLATKLAYCFKRDTVTIYGNVVKATHGETRKEVLGSGDGSKGLQSFALKQPPLTYVSASNPSGVDSTLKIYVDDVQWRETDFLPGLSPTDRKFITKTDDESKTTVVFGNGLEGARLPTGIENIKAEYRNGIGKMGNVKAGQISLLSTRPLGVKEVINPLRASGGADKESRDQARKNAPLAVKALDRLVSVQDYEDFARTYAGIGKARAVELSDGRRQLVHITVAGVEDIPIDKSSDLYRNLRQALLDFGDPYQAIQLEIRELMLIVISGRIRILPEYQWEPVVTQVRAALLEAFGFERRELGQDVLLSEVISVMQAVRGVAYVDVDIFGGIPEKNVKEVEELVKDKIVTLKKRVLLTPQEIAASVQKLVRDSNEERIPESRLKVNLAEFEKETGKIRPAQLAFLTPEVPDTLILNQIT